MTKDGNSRFYHGRVFTATGTALIFISLGILPYALMTEKTQALYTLVFDKVIEVLRTTVGNGATNIINMVSDYEFVILNAMSAAFPKGTPRGCGFISAKYDNFLFFILVLSSHFIEKRPFLEK